MKDQTLNRKLRSCDDLISSSFGADDKSLKDDADASEISSLNDVEDLKSSTSSSSSSSSFRATKNVIRDLGSNNIFANESVEKINKMPGDEEIDVQSWDGASDIEKYDLNSPIENIDTIFEEEVDDDNDDEKPDDSIDYDQEGVDFNFIKAPPSTESKKRKFEDVQSTSQEMHNSIIRDHTNHHSNNFDHFFTPEINNDHSSSRTPNPVVNHLDHMYTQQQIQYPRYRERHQLDPPVLPIHTFNANHQNSDPSDSTGKK